MRPTPSMVLHSTGLVFVAILSGFGGTGCGTGLPNAPVEQPEELLIPPPLLVVESPREDVTYTGVDDVDAASGLQVPLIVIVNDEQNREFVDVVTVVVNGVETAITVNDGAFGRGVQSFITIPDVPALATSTVVSLTVRAILEDESVVDVNRTVSSRFVAPLSCQPLTLNGDLTIANDADAQSLAGESCVVVTGNVVIESSALASLTGLSPIVSIGGALRIANNDALSTLNGLSQLTFVGGDLIITENASISDEAALNLVDTIGRDRVVGAIVIGDNGEPG